MREVVPRTLFWAPRVLCVLFALFLTVFALDVFQPGKPAAAVALDLATHLMPTFLVLLILAVAWRHELLCPIVFAGLGVLCLVAFLGPLPLVGVRRDLGLSLRGRGPVLRQLARQAAPSVGPNPGAAALIDSRPGPRRSRRRPPNERDGKPPDPDR